ncbi:hydrogen peroxide-dependent heme synthase [Schaalia odontolytica]|uniref:hydrogen peroxide-dependent heme synthase n=1 Tax=Schaalia odontolytica TaxID=1660 RepID=UPI00211CB3E6|nr:hydrogen peroxide-dependent heme synthase [Schaalia odontolytica]UUO93614.1 ferrochelatase [Schaalia odontolytica]
MDTYDAIMLLSYGGPNGEEDVLPFMRNATRGRGIPDERLLQVAAHYKRFGGVSPINACNQRLIANLSAELARRGHDIPVGWGNRNWHPFVAEGLDELAQAGARRILVLPTSAYASYSGCRQYREDLAEAAQALREKWGTIVLGGEDSADNPHADIILDKVRPYYSTPGMARAQITSIRRSWEALTARGLDTSGIRLIFVTHSIPVSMEAGSSPFPFRPSIGEAPAPESDRAEQQGSGASSSAGTPATEVSYVAQHHALIQAIMPELRRVLGRADLGYDLVYCSRSGPPQARWLEPDINDFLEEIADGGSDEAAGNSSDTRPLSGVVVVPIGFICDHMEVVYDLDTEARETAARLGIPYERADTVSTDPDFVSSLVDVLEERAAQARGENPEHVTVTGTGPFHTVCPSNCCLSLARPGHPSPGVGGAHPGAVTTPHSSGAPTRAAGQPDTTQEKSMSAQRPHAVSPDQNPDNPGHPAGVPDRVGEHAARHQARHAGTEATPHSHAAHARVTDPRDATDVDFDEVNNKQHYALYSVFALGESLPADDGERGRVIAESLDYVKGAGAEIRGFYDVSGFRAEADLMVWWLDDDPEVLQDAYHRLRACALGKFLDPVWSCMGLHTPAEFNKRHIPACFGGVAPRDWAMVYPFVRSYDWYLKAPDERARIMAEHGRNGFSQYPDVKGSTLSAFGFSDYEWVLAFEADSLDRLEGVMHAQRYTEARLYVREDTPFFTGPRVSLGEWAERQPRG